MVERSRFRDVCCPFATRSDTAALPRRATSAAVISASL
jgi:hypothetical protein